MGTPHLICLYHNGRVVVAQYGGHDGHPSHTGRDIMHLLSDPRFQRRLRAKLPLVRHRSPNADYNSCHAGSIDEKAGSSALDDIAYAEGPLLHSFCLEFASQGACCEWVYLIDLDSEVLEVYSGVGGSRFGTTPVVRGRLAEVGARGQVLRVAIPFVDLPGDKEELVKACTAGDEEEEERLW